MTRAGPHRLRNRVATAFGVACLAVYLFWNGWWLWHGQVPPALLRALTGLPAPTAGGTRSMLALLQGDIAGALHYNPMALPMAAMFVWTAVQWWRRGTLQTAYAWYWLAILGVAWLLKLMSPVETW